MEKENPWFHIIDFIELFDQKLAEIEANGKDPKTGSKSDFWTLIGGRDHMFICSPSDSRGHSVPELLLIHRGQGLKFST